MSEKTRPVSRKPWRRSFTVCGLVVVLLLLPFVVRAYFLSTVPVMAEPFDVAAFLGDNIPSGENAFTDYRQASDLHQRLVAGLQQNSATEPITYDAVYEKGWTAIDERLEAWLDDHREALTVWRRGTEKDRALNLSPAQMTLATVIVVIQDMRTFLRFAWLEQARCLHEGDVEEAWKWGRAAFRSGGHTSQRGCFIQGLVGVAIHAMSAKGLALWAEHPSVTTEQLREALATVRADNSLYERASNNFKAEYLMTCNTLSTPAWIGMRGPDAVTPNSSTQAEARRMFYWFMGEPELTRRLHRQILANQIREIDKPVSMRAKTAGAGMALLFAPDPATPLALRQLNPAGIDRGLNRSFPAKMYLPATKQVDDAFLRRRALQAALEVLFAAQVYRRDYGEFPKNLDQLVPQYLETVPLDPCDPSGGSLHYRRDLATEAVVWSVSYDRTDGGGDVASARPTDAGFVLKGAGPR
ncbi:MAG: hypothetical protein H7062_16455 [Candidatus Saccharimonas sp.]|nr:hypothetical protein [Planctomycetaceae bacterium]